MKMNWWQFGGLKKCLSPENDDKKEGIREKDDELKACINELFAIVFLFFDHFAIFARKLYKIILIMVTLFFS